MVTDWRELPAGRELNEVVLRRLGWREYFNPDSGFYGIQLGDTETIIGGYLRQEDAWNTFQLTEDAGQALSLWDGKTTWGHVGNHTDMRDGRKFWRAMTSGGKDDGYQCEAEHADPAMAIVLSWLAYKDATDGK